jgi:hypothetical protein
MKNPYTPIHLIAAFRKGREFWHALSDGEQITFMKKAGLLGADGHIHPDYDWTPERYEREFGHAAK